MPSELEEERHIEDLDPSVSEYTIVDTDVHTVDVIEDLAEYVDDDDPWKPRFEHGEPRVKAGGAIWPKSVGSRTRYGRIKREHVSDAWDREVVEEQMEFLGTDHTILVGMAMLLYGEITWDDTRMSTHAEAYTRYMLSELVDADENTYTLLPAPYKEPERAAELIDDFADEPGIVGVCLVSPGAEPPLGNHKYNPIYEATERAGLPIVYHSGGSGLDEYHTKGYSKFIETHTLGFMNANLSQLCSVITQGVPERYPDLDIALVESGIAYVVALMYRLDAEYLKRQSEAPYLEKLPSEYMKNDIYYGTQPLEDAPNQDLEQLMRMMGGPDNLMYASDYPHWDYDPPNTITSLPFLDEAEKEMILSGNAMEVFDL